MNGWKTRKLQMDQIYFNDHTVSISIGIHNFPLPCIIGLDNLQVHCIIKQCQFDTVPSLANILMKSHSSLYISFKKYTCRHLDGNHKLIRWRMVVHGGVDGFSRSVVLLRFSNNNEAETVLEQFLLGTQTFHFPRRIRTDYGTENVKVAMFMLQKYGVTSNPVITGRSVHSQRIERMWRDVLNYVLHHYRSLFYFLESEEELDPDDEVHSLALQYVYLLRVNRALDYFTTQWNNHPLSTEGNRSPLQIWTAGFYQFAESDYQAVRDVLDVQTFNFNAYGVDDDGPLPPIETSNHAVVPRSLIRLSEEENTHLHSEVIPLSDDGNYGINLYKRTVNLVEQFLSEHEPDSN